MSGDPLPELALVPGGEFLMGSVDAEEDERPVHRVHLDDFYLGAQPVTNADYGRFVRASARRARPMSGPTSIRRADRAIIP